MSSNSESTGPRDIDKDLTPAVERMVAPRLTASLSLELSNEEIREILDDQIAKIRRELAGYDGDGAYADQHVTEIDRETFRVGVDWGGDLSQAVGQAAAHYLASEVDDVDAEFDNIHIGAIHIEVDQPSYIEFFTTNQ